MKIDIGNGKILGTKKVSPNGQVSGFTEYAGQEVLVILPAGEPEVRMDAREVFDELREATTHYMRVALKDHQALRERLKGPNEAARQFMEARGPRSFNGLFDKVDAWLSEQAEPTKEPRAQNGAPAATESSVQRDQQE